MKKIFIFAAMAATALTSCNKEEISAPDESRDNFVYREFNAVIEDGVSTRVAFGDPADGKIPVSFQNGDEIAITDGTNVYKGTVSVPEGKNRPVKSLIARIEFPLISANIL